MNIILYMEKNCPEGKKIKSGLDIMEYEYRVYYLDQHFTMEQFHSTFGEEQKLPKLIRN